MTPPNELARNQDPSGKDRNDVRAGSSCSVPGTQLHRTPTSWTFKTSSIRPALISNSSTNTTPSKQHSHSTCKSHHLFYHGCMTVPPPADYVEIENLTVACRSTTSTVTARPHGWVSSMVLLEMDERMLTVSVALQAVPLIASPSMIMALLSPEVREASSTCQLQTQRTHQC